MRLFKKKTCIDCHFFMKQYKTLKSHVSIEERKVILSDDYSWATNYCLGCFMGVWDEGYGVPQERDELIVKTDRRNFCFFWQYRPGMFFPAGEVLQKRESELAQSKRDRRLTIIGLFIAAMALVGNVILTLLAQY